MSDILKSALAPRRIQVLQPALPPPLPLIAQFGLSLLFVALATLIAFVVDNFISSSNLALIYVLPVVVTATFFGWLPSLLAVISGVATFDFLFTEPYYSLAITKPPEIWAAAMLLVIATIVGSLASRSRQGAVEAREAAERAEALHALAHAVIGHGAYQEILQAAAQALHRIFKAPVVILTLDGEEMAVSATRGGAQASQADKEAARGALSLQVGTRGETYPYDRTTFDFWPVSAPGGRSCVLGVDFAHAARERPPSCDELFEGVAGYITAALVPGSPLHAPEAES